MNAYGSTMSTEMCSKWVPQKLGEKIIFDHTCQIGAMSSTGHTEYSGSFDSAFTVNTTSMTTGGPALANGKSNMITEAKWMGPCKPDQKPGDMIMPVGNPAGRDDQDKYSRHSRHNEGGAGHDEGDSG
jgi:hypothetical protein